MSAPPSLNARTAPKGWEPVVADLAERHADEMEAWVRALRALAGELRRGI